MPTNTSDESSSSTDNDNTDDDDDDDDAECGTVIVLSTPPESPDSRMNGFPEASPPPSIKQEPTEDDEALLDDASIHLNNLNNASSPNP